MEKPTCETTFVVPFHDVDMLKVAWHGHYYKYFELGRTALFRKYDFDVENIAALGYYMVISESFCRYLRPLLYGMTITVSATLEEHEFYLQIDYELRNPSDKRLAWGRTKQVTLNRENNELFMTTPRPVLAAFGLDENNEDEE